MKEWLVAAIGSMFLLGSSSGAAIQEKGKMPRPERPASTSQQMRNIDITCVAAAVNTRETTLASVVSTHQQSVAAAYAARKTALASAYTGSDPQAVKTAVKKAWTDFQTAGKSAKQIAERSRKNTWEAFKTAMKACKGGESVGDAQNASTDQI